MKAKIILKSGAAFEVDVEDFETGRNPHTRALTSMSWETPDDWTAKLHTIELGEIAAIVVIRDLVEVAADA